MTSPPRLAGEWEQQAGVLISWPTRSTDWRDNFADAEATYLELAVIIARINHLYICCDDLTTRQHVQKLLTAEDLPTDRYDLFTIPYNDTWTRDYGPISVYRENAVAWLNYEFNAWGGKFAHQQDNQLLVFGSFCKGKRIQEYLQQKPEENKGQVMAPEIKQPQKRIQCKKVC